MAMLEVNNLAVNYGVINAKGVSFKINEGEIVSLIGANGAGKTTILKTISGSLKPVSGTISYEGKELQKQKHRRSWSRDFPGTRSRHIFPGMSVRENLQMGAFLQNNRADRQAVLRRCIPGFQCSKSASIRMPLPYLAVNSRCSPWAGH